MDREITSNYTLYVKATDNCSLSDSYAILNSTITDNAMNNYLTDSIDSKIQSLRLENRKYFNLPDRYKHSRSIRDIFDPEILMKDNTIVRLRIRVLDINDNPPKFTSNIYTGGITTNADFGIKFMQVKVSIIYTLPKK